MHHLEPRIIKLSLGKASGYSIDYPSDVQIKHYTTTLIDGKSAALDAGLSSLFTSILVITTSRALSYTINH
jgi:hypothetical protein